MLLVILYVCVCSAVTAGNFNTFGNAVLSLSLFLPRESLFLFRVEERKREKEFTFSLGAALEFLHDFFHSSSHLEQKKIETKFKSICFYHHVVKNHIRSSILVLSLIVFLIIAMR